MGKENNKKLNIQKKSKFEILEKIVFWFIFTTLIGTMVFVIVAICIGGYSKEVNVKTIWSNVGDLIVCLLGLMLLLLPSFTEKKFKIKMPNAIYLMFILFLFLSIYLGHVIKLYRKIPYYDTFVHTFSGIVIGLISMSILKTISDNSKVKFKPWFILMFSVCFTVTLGVLWEIWEFLRDVYTGTNMQRYADVKTGSDFVGKEALKDTMRDLIVDLFGALFAGFIGFFAVSKDSKNFDKLTFVKTKGNKTNKNSYNTLIKKRVK